MKVNTNIASQSGAMAHYSALKSLLKPPINRTLVQSGGMPYNGAYFVVSTEGCIDEISQDAPGARAFPGRKKPVGLQPLVDPGKYSVVALGRRGLTQGLTQCVRTIFLNSI